MIFDKNQKEFPSEKHKKIWGYGVRIMPEDLVLSDKVKSLMDGDLYESCRQMRLFLLHSLGKMYENAECYEFEPEQYIFLWFWLSSKPRVGTRNFAVGSIYNKKLCSLDQLEKYCLDLFVKTGVEINYINDSQKDKTAEITNTLYPNMLRAMGEMFNIVKAKKENSTNNSFSNCDFRVLCPGYTKEKGEKIDAAQKPSPENIAENVADETVKQNILDFVGFLRGNKLSPQWSATNAAKEYIWNVNIKGKNVFNIRINEITGDWWVSIFGRSFDPYKQHITDAGLQKLLLGSIMKRGCRKEQECGIRRKNEPFFGTILNGVCICHFSFRIHKPDGTDLKNLKKLVLESKTIFAKL